MEEEPIVFRSPLKFNVYLVVVTIVCAVVFVDAARFTLVTISTDPFAWLLLSSFSFLVMVFVDFPAVWKMRKLLSYSEPLWDMRTRELAPSEYAHIVREYRRQYVHIVTHVNIFYLFSLVILGMMTVMLPILLLALSPLFMQYAPYLYGILLILFALTMSRFLYGIIPTAASESFSIKPLGSIKRGLDLLSRCAGISWWGVRVKIGESQGLYVLKDAIPVGRVSGLESDAAILVHMEKRQPVSIEAERDWQDEHLVVPITTDPDDALYQLVLQLLQSFVQTTGDFDTVAEVLYDLGVKSGDELISGKIPHKNS
ncbi:MAG: hypothetical protein K9W43_03695 [Candidatus Thorarchaeota archaeon]|nr:hypothetical protein [Candidatus Thorarchaeota archaeon]